MSDNDTFDFVDTDLGGSVDAWDADEGFAVDISAKEAGAEAFEASIVPAGWYHVAVTEVELEESKSTKNPGKPMFAVKLTIQDGPYKGRVMYDRWCLWTNALYSVSMAMKAVGLPVNEGSIRIPPAGWWMGKKMLLQIKVGNKMTKNEVTEKYDIPEKDENGKFIKQNNCGGYKPVPADWDGDKGHKKQEAAKIAGPANLAP